MTVRPPGRGWRFGATTTAAQSQAFSWVLKLHAESTERWDLGGDLTPACAGARCVQQMSKACGGGATASLCRG